MQTAIESLQVSIQKFSPKGYGIGALPSGKEVEIAHSVIGDEALIAWKKKKRPPQKGRLLEIISPSCDRVEPRCAHARVCGGCSWQQINYEAQLKEKEQRVREMFGREVDPIVGAEEIFGYRNKMEFTFSENRGGQKFLGLMIAQAEPYVFNLTECHLGPSWFAEMVNRVRDWWEESKLSAYYPPEDRGSLRYLTLRAGLRTGQKMVVLNVSGNPEYALKREQLESFVKAVGEASIFVRIHQTKKGKPTQFYEMHLAGSDHIIEELWINGKKWNFKISPISFFQPNPLQAEKLYELALGGLEECQTVYDLYCGTGTLSIAASKYAEKVVGIELSPEAVLDAEENQKLNGVENVTFYQGDVGKVLTGLSKWPDSVLIDPPRAGLDPLAMHHLKILLPRQIIYISCNPVTQAANVEELLKAGYILKRLQPVDLFPHTYHIEIIAFLERNLPFRHSRG